MNFLPSTSQQATMRAVLRALKVKEGSSESGAIYQCLKALVDKANDAEKLEKRVISLEREISELKRHYKR